MLQKRMLETENAANLPLTTSHQRMSNGIDILGFKGSMDNFSAEEVVATCRNTINTDGDTSGIVLDLTEVNFIDYAGIVACVNFFELAAQKGIKKAFAVSPQGQPLTMFQFLRLDKVVVIKTTVDDAMKAILE